MDKIIAYLTKADRYLDQISVRGTDAFALVSARQMLRAAYDEAVVETQAETGEVSDDG